MKNIYPIIFAFNNSEISLNTQNTYESFVRELMQKLGQTEVQFPRGSTIIPVNDSAPNYSASNFIELQIREALQQLELITSGNEPTLNFQKDKIIVIDFLSENAIESKHEFNFLYMIDSLLESFTGADPSLKFVIIHSKVFDNTTLSSETLFDKYAKAKQVIMFDNKGNSTEEADKQHQIFTRYRKLIFGDAYELFKKKLLRRVGHFKRPADGDHARCHLFFYDGSHCQQELRHILLEKLSELNPDYIIYDCPESKWLENSIKNALPYFKEKSITAYNFLKEADKISKIKSDSKTLLIVDLIHKGERFEKIINELKSTNADLFPELKALSVLKAVHTPTNEEIKIESPSSIADFEYSFIHAVHQKEFLQPSECEMCNPYQIPQTDKYAEIESELSAYFYWLLINDKSVGVKFKAEENPPKHRPALSTVPDFKALLIFHGPYIAYKIKTLLLEKGIGISSFKDYTFICPDEEGAKEVGRSISYFFDAEVLSIPKPDIEQIIEQEMPRSRVEHEFKDAPWLKHLLRIERSGKSKSVILFDEFVVTKTTFNEFTQFLDIFDYKISCYLPIFQFADLKYGTGETPIYSLYKFKLYLGNPYLN